ncbi:MAG: hypothetical protein KDK48_06000, partial [Chlamydiia bacterium]|nr:hypothetical protein [Chlamydiia bacterium]
RNSIRQKEWVASLLENSLETAPYRLSCFGQCQLDDYLVRLLPGSPPSTYMLTSENTTLVLNPGRGFLRQFLENGSRLEALNAILLTRGDILSLGDTLALLRLKAATEQESQISVFAPPVLLHRIQANLTAAESEYIKTLPLPTEGSKKQTLSNELSFEIFTPPHAATAEGALYRYGLKIHLHTPSTLTTIGFSSGLNFSKELASLLSGVDILIAGIGKTTSTEVSQGTFLPDCLGYTGAKHLIEKIKPKVAFLDELCGSFGDVRLEVTRQMRQDLGEKAAILPSSPGMTFDLKKQLIQATDKEDFIDPKMTRVVRGAPSSMRLHYASCCDIL